MYVPMWQKYSVWRYGLQGCTALTTILLFNSFRLLDKLNKTNCPYLISKHQWLAVKLEFLLIEIHRELHFLLDFFFFSFSFFILFYYGLVGKDCSSFILSAGFRIINLAVSFLLYEEDECPKIWRGNHVVFCVNKIYHQNEMKSLLL